LFASVCSFVMAAAATTAAASVGERSRLAPRDLIFLQRDVLKAMGACRVKQWTVSSGTLKSEDGDTLASMRTLFGRPDFSCTDAQAWLLSLPTVRNGSLVNRITPLVDADTVVLACLARRYLRSSNYPTFVLK
jgi:hypothetical protein